MTTRDPNPDQIDAPEAFDAVELATERDVARVQAEQSVAETPRPVEGGSAEDAQASLLERALRTAGSDAARYLPVRFVPALTSLITTPLFTRAIDKADYGAFYLISAVASLMSSIAVNWLVSSSVRFYWPSKKKDALDSYVATVVWTGLASLLAFAAITGAATLLGSGRIDEVVLRLVPAGLVYFIAHFYGTLLLQILRAANRAGAFARLSITVTVLVTGVSVALVIAGWGSAGILVGAAVGNVIVVPFMLRSIRAEGSLAPTHIDRRLLSEMLSYGMPLVPVGLAGWALVLLDRFVVQFFRGPAEVGVYSVAYSLGDKIMQLATMPLLLTMIPSLTEAFELRGQDLAEKMQSHFTRYFAILTFPLLAGLAAVSGTFMQVFTGPQYREAYSVLPIVAAGTMFGQLANIAGTGLGMHKKTTVIMANTLAATGFNLVANVALVPRFGYFAAAVDTVASYALLLGLTWYRSRDYMRWLIPWGALARVAGACAVMGAAVVALTFALPASVWSLLAEIAAGILVYAMALVLLRGVRAEETAFVRELAARAAARLRKASGS